MKLQLLQDNFSKALSIASRFASPKVQLPVLANILLTTQKNKLLISATNLEMSISLSIGAKVEEEGTLTIPSKTLTDIVSNLGKGTINLESDKEQLIINTEDFNSKVTGMNSSEFPAVPQTVNEGSLEIPAAAFENALNQVLFSVSQDESRPILTGVLIIFQNDTVSLVSTDGFRLSQKKIKIPGLKDERRVILPKSALSELSHLGVNTDIFHFFQNKGEGQAIFGVGDTVMSTRTIEGEFPDFEKIIPKNSLININVDSQDLLRGIKLAGIFARDAANVVKMEVKKDTVEISAESSKSGNQKTNINAKIENNSGSDCFIIAFNYRYLEEFLNSIKGESVNMRFNDPNASGVFTNPKDSDYLHIIMPVRLQS
jgi:DNA polymerase-3 subunit beta